MNTTAKSDKDRVVTELGRRAPTWLAELPWLLDADDMDSLRQRILGATRERMLREMTEALEALAAERPIVLVCRTDKRSVRAAEILSAAGAPDRKNGTSAPNTAASA